MIEEELKLLGTWKIEIGQVIYPGTVAWYDHESRRNYQDACERIERLNQQHPDTPFRIVCVFHALPPDYN